MTYRNVELFRYTCDVCGMVDHVEPVNPSVDVPPDHPDGWLMMRAQNPIDNKHICLRCATKIHALIAGMPDFYREWVIPDSRSDVNFEPNFRPSKRAPST